MEVKGKWREKGSEKGREMKKGDTGKVGKVTRGVGEERGMRGEEGETRWWRRED